jgi:hypothetical protein
MSRNAPRKLPYGKGIAIRHDCAQAEIRLRLRRASFQSLFGISAPVSPAPPSGGGPAARFALCQQRINAALQTAGLFDHHPVGAELNNPVQLRLHGIVSTGNTGMISGA